MDLNDVNVTVKTAFCNTQVAEAFAAAVVASSREKDSVIKDSYDLEIQKLNNELKTLKENIDCLQTSFIGNRGAGDKNSKSTESHENKAENSNPNGKFTNDEWEILQKYIYEHFKQQANTESRIKDLEDSIIRDKENFNSRNNVIGLIEKNLEASTEQITTLLYLVSDHKEKINSLEDKVKILEERITNLNEKLNSNLKIFNNLVELPDLLMTTLNSQSNSWSIFCDFLKKLGKEVDYFIKRNTDSFDENNSTDELASLFKKLIESMQKIQPIMGAQKSE